MHILDGSGRIALLGRDHCLKEPSKGEEPRNPPFGAASNRLVRQRSGLLGIGGAQSYLTAPKRRSRSMPVSLRARTSASGSRGALTSPATGSQRIP
jgi:hypothetical protein